jgi:hypothetical protein
MSRTRKLTLVVVVPGLLAFGFDLAVVVRRGVGYASFWAVVLSVPLAAVAAVVGLRASDADRPTAPGAPPRPGWAVDRPAQVAKVARALSRRRGGTAGITTGLHGAGGFGKTTLAKMACADRRVRRRFRDRVYWVTVGQDVRDPAAVAAKVNDVIRMVSGEAAVFPDPWAAGARLKTVLKAGPRRLLVLDDVWQEEQLAPFVGDLRRYSLLVTTRVPGLLAERDVAVRVDQMLPEEAREVLTSGGLRLPPALAEGLLKATGRWPLPLRLVAEILTNASKLGADVAEAGQLVLERLQAEGAEAIDDLSGKAGQDLDVKRPEERQRAVRATIGASTSLLGSGDAERLAELGVFAEDETIPFALISRLWQATGGLDELQALRLCTSLAELALVSITRTGTEGVSGVTVHDVVRDVLRRKLGPQRLAGLHGVLAEQAATGLPAARSLSGWPRK